MQVRHRITSLGTNIGILLTDARRYFKQSEIVLYRQAPELPQPLAIDNPGVGGKQPIQAPPVPA